MFWLSFFPEGEIDLVVFLAHSVEFAAVVYHVVEVSVREDAILMVFVIFLYVEIHASVAFVGISVVDDFLHELFLLNDVSCGMGFNAWRQHVESLHGVVIAVGVVLCYLHGLKLFESCLLLYLVVSLVGIVLEVSHVCNVTHVAHFVSEMLEITEEDVEGDGRARVSEMRVAIYCRSANIHSHVWGVYRLEEHFASSQCIVNQKILFHTIFHLFLFPTAKLS